MPEQFGWRFCDKCFGMFFNGDPDPARKGVCPGGGMHHAQGFVFRLPFNVPESVGQPGWSFCDRCFSMFFNGDPASKGVCPAGGGHHPQGLIFVLPHDVPETVGQPGWAFCERCFVMFFNGNPTNKGRCPAGGAHLFQGFLFVLPHIDFPHPSITLLNKSEPREGEFVEVAGVGFVPGQGLVISHDIFHGGSLDDHEFGTVQDATDPSGRFIHHIPILGHMRSTQARVTDLGSGEVVTALLEV